MGIAMATIRQIDTQIYACIRKMDLLLLALHLMCKISLMLALVDHLMTPLRLIQIQIQNLIFHPCY